MRKLKGELGPSVCILIKDTLLKRKELTEAYGDYMAISLDYDKKKPSADFMKTYNAKLVKVLHKAKIDFLLIADANYYKSLTGAKKISDQIGEVMPIKGSHIEAMYIPSYGAYFVNPDSEAIAERVLKQFNELVDGTYSRTEVELKHEYYPESDEAIEACLQSLLQHDALTIDIEAYSLNHYDAGIGTISLAWSDCEGVAFCVDTVETVPTEIQVWCTKDKKYKTKIGLNKYSVNEFRRKLLKRFFQQYQGTCIYHNVSYDVYAMVYALFMKDLLDVKGMYEGMDIMLKKWHCTQLLTYLATNSAAGNHLGLKYQSQEFTGNYAEDVKDIRMLAVKPLLKYNLIDTCATWFVLDKHLDTVVLDDQLPLYDGLFRDSIYDIIQMQLTGLCLDMDQVLIAGDEIQGITTTEYDKIQGNVLVTQACEVIAEMQCEKNYQDRRKKAKKPENIVRFAVDRFRTKFNPNSGNQLAVLLYNIMDLPVVDFTKTKSPATGNKTIAKLLVYAKDDTHKDLLKSVIEYMLASKIITSFIPAFKKAPKGPDGYHYLYGKYKLGGCVSGRLSSSDPNMQNIPSGGRFSKVIKKCFIAPKGQLFMGIDADSLEDRVDTLLTQDPNKLKIYTEGYDGHAYRAFYYWGSEMPDIVDTAESVNSIKNHKIYKAFRKNSKAPTFLLTYFGTYRGLMKNCGFDEPEAIRIEMNYHEMYKVSDAWKAAKLAQAALDGYTTVAFGLRVRAPLMAATIMGTSKTPFEAEAESRTVGNAFGQSYCLINGRNGAEITKKIRASKWRYLILLVAQIHDACYFRLPDSMEAIAFLNKICVEAYAWCDMPELYHPTVKLSGSLEMFYPTWADGFDMPNVANPSEIKDALIAEASKRVA